MPKNIAAFPKPRRDKVKASANRIREDNTAIMTETKTTETNQYLIGGVYSTKPASMGSLKGMHRAESPRKAKQLQHSEEAKSNQSPKI